MAHILLTNVLLNSIYSVVKFVFKTDNQQKVKIICVMYNAKYYSSALCFGEFEFYFHKSVCTITDLYATRPESGCIIVFVAWEQLTVSSQTHVHLSI